VNVLLVDDSLTVRMDLSEAFEESGFEVRLCSDLSQAREALGGKHWDVIVLDVLLPDGDGIELLAEVRTELKESVVLLLSSETEVRSRVRGLTSGADEYVGKPYDREYLVDRARQLVEARHPRTRDERPLILLVDDSATARRHYKQALEEQRYRVLTASSGEEGLRLTALYRPAALIVDGQLPGIDGCTVIRQLRLDEALRATPCLLLTGSELSEQQSLEAGADAFLRKDDDLETVLARVGAAIRGAGEVGEITPSLLGPKRLLMVNQERRLFNALACDGYDLIPARTAQESLELLAFQRVDCILLTTAELELCRHIKASDDLRDIPLMVVTERDEPETTVACLAEGADDTITRNSDLQLLRARLRAQLRRSQLEGERRRIQKLEAAQRDAASQLAEARALLIRQLEEKNRELEAFSYSVSHDLRAPLRAILGFSSALQKDCAEAIGEKGNFLISRILKSGERMNLLIDDMLALARISTASLELLDCDLSDLCRHILDDLRAAHPERHVEVAIENSLQTRADPRMLKILLENLIGNAWKFTSRNPGARIEISSPSPDLFLVRDNGAGFDLQAAGKLFAPFQRFHPSSQFEGTGVGLATVHRVVSRHGGNIWAESNPDHGAAFFFQLTAPTAPRSDI